MSPEKQVSSVSPIVMQLTFLPVLIACAVVRPMLAADAPRPNIILMMADDLGYGDTGYQGHPLLHTPHLDEMAAAGLRFDRFYASSPVCSPTRGSCLTGRHPYRYGIVGANRGHLPARERNLAEILGAEGYRTGHFGKWHLGTLTREGRDSNRGGDRNLEHYAPPWEHGFEVCFSTEAKVPTRDPMVTPDKLAGGVGNKTPGDPYGTAYWTGPEQRETENLAGDDSRIIMDRVVPFLQDSVAADRPFFAVVWFHAPHLPVVAGPQDLALYPDLEEKTRHYYGCITAMDRQIGRLRQALTELGVRDDTLLWFASDNGPEGKEGQGPGASGGLRGRKRSLYEGGIRVPGLLEWPAVIPAGRTVEAPVCTSDYLATILDLLGGESERPLDGVSLVPWIEGGDGPRSRPIGFEAGNQVALIGDRYKLVRVGQDRPYQLFDLIDDPAEQADLAAEQPERVEAMIEHLTAWRASCEQSRRRR